MRIAVCDDEKNYRDSVIKSIKSNNNMLGEDEPEIHSFSCGEDLITYFEKGDTYDLIFLDIEMDGINGIETAKAIEKISEDVIFIFLTSHGEYILESFSVQTIFYLLKPIDEEKIKQAFNKFLKVFFKNKLAIDLSWDSYITTVLLKDIIYMESIGHFTNVHFKDKSLKSNKNLKYYEKSLSNRGFFRCHNQLMVNFFHIQTINIIDISTTQGMRIELSERKRADCLSLFNKYLREISV